MQINGRDQSKFSPEKKIVNRILFCFHVSLLFAKAVSMPLDLNYIPQATFVFFYCLTRTKQASHDYSHLFARYDQHQNLQHKRLVLGRKASDKRKNIDKDLVHSWGQNSGKKVLKYKWGVNQAYHPFLFNTERVSQHLAKKNILHFLVHTRQVVC